MNDTDKPKQFTVVVGRQFDNPGDAMAWLMCQTISEMSSAKPGATGPEGFGMLCCMPWQEIVSKLDPEGKFNKSTVADTIMKSMGFNKADEDDDEDDGPTATNRLN